MIKRFLKPILLLLLVACFGTLIIDGYIARSDLENNGKTIIGSYLSYRRHPKTQSNYFVFFINGQKCERDAGKAPAGFQYNRGKYYKILYSEKHDIFRVLFDQEVTDTIKILEAGFSSEDIKRGLRTQKRNRDFVR